jgi:hypothetical protein
MKRGLTAVFIVCAIAGALAASPATALAKTGTKLAVSLANGITMEHYGYVPALNATLKTSRGRAVKGVYVSLYCNGVKRATKKTNSSGKVSFTASTAAVGDYHGLWQVKYSGNSRYKGCSSVKKRTDVDLHYLGEETVPAFYDYDDDSEGEYVVNIRLKLYGGETYGLHSSTGTLRMVYGDADSATDIYPGQYAEKEGAFTPSTTDYYDIWMECATGDPMNILLW